MHTYIQPSLRHTVRVTPHVIRGDRVKVGPGRRSHWIWFGGDKCFWIWPVYSLVSPRPPSPAVHCMDASIECGQKKKTRRSTLSCGVRDLQVTRWRPSKHSSEWAVSTPEMFPSDTQWVNLELSNWDLLLNTAWNFTWDRFSIRLNQSYVHT